MPQSTIWSGRSQKPNTQPFEVPPSHIHISFNACLPNLIRPGGGVRVIWRAELLFKVGLNGGTVRPTRPTCDLGKADQINNNLSFEITSCRHLFKTSLPI